MLKKITFIAALVASVSLFACLPKRQTLFFSAKLSAEPGPILEVGQTAKLLVLGRNFPEGLRYQWLIDAGGGTCNPQNSAEGKTLYQAPDNIGELSEKPVKVTVEFYLDGAKQDEQQIVLTIKKPEAIATPAGTPESIANVLSTKGPSVEITKSGVFDSKGERLAEDTIEGRVFGVVPSEHQILLYALSGGQWWIQPYSLGSGRFTEIQSNGHFSNTYHVGVKYSAILCKRGWENPPIQTLVLPLDNENVVAFSIVDGVKPIQ